MPAITIKGVAGISIGMQELGNALSGALSERTINYSIQQARQRLEQDTPVITGRLFRSTTIRKDSPTSQTLGQHAPYANVVNNRRGYWQGAINIARDWPRLYQKAVSDEIGIIGRKYGGT